MPKEPLFFRISAAFILFAVTLHILAFFLPARSAWGFHFLEFLPRPEVVILCILAALAIAAAFHGETTARLAAALRNITLTAPKRFLTILLLCLVSCALLWSFRTGTYFLGDGYLRIRRLALGNILELTEPLDVFFHALFSGLLTEKSAEMSYVLISIACGLLFILLIYIKIGTLAKSSLQAIATVLIIACSGFLQLFFGYPESYGMSTLFITAYVLVSCKFLDSYKPFVLPCVLFSLAVSTHLISIALLPSLVLLYAGYFKTCGFSWKKLLAVLLSLLAVPFALYFALFFLVRDFNAHLSAFMHGILGAEEPFFLPLFKGYSVFSPDHFLDFLNEIMLAAPAVILLLPLMSGLRKSQDRAGTFLFSAALVPLITAFCVDPKLGASRDWDFLSFFAMPLNLLVARLLFSRIKEDRYLSSISLLLLSLTMLHTVPWVLTNAGRETSLKRFNTLLESGSVRLPHNAYEELYIYHRDRNEDSAAKAALEKAIAAAPGNRRLSLSLAYFYYLRQDLAEAGKQAAALVRQHPDYADAHFLLANILHRQGRHAEARDELLKVLEIVPDYPGARDLLASWHGKILY